jgi:(2Fe-2S) ferredoxin
MSHYQYHVFFCLNQREGPRPCCAAQGAEQAFEHCKKAVKAAGLAGPGKVRVNRAGCMERCEQGPVCVVYPQGVWYTYVDQQDIDEIVERHLKHGEIVERLLVPPETVA